MGRRGNKKQVMCLDAFLAAQPPSTAPLPPPRVVPATSSLAAGPVVRLGDIMREQECQQRALEVARKQAQLAAIENARLAAIAQEKAYALEQQRLEEEAAQWEADRPQREARAAEEEVQRQQQAAGEEVRRQVQAAAEEARWELQRKKDLVSASQKHKNGLKKLLQMTPEMRAYLDSFDGEVEFTWSRNRRGERDLNFSLQNVLSCTAYDEDDGEYSFGREECRVRSWVAAASEVVETHLDELSEDLFFGRSSASDYQLWKGIAMHLAKTDSAEACLPRTPLNVRRAVDAWIEERNSALEREATRAEEYYGYASSLRNELDQDEMTALRDLLVTHKASFTQELFQMIDVAQTTTKAVEQVHEHVREINDNLDRAHVNECKDAEKPQQQKRCRCHRQLTQERFNHWDGLVSLTSIPIAMLLVLLDRSGR